MFSLIALEGWGAQLYAKLIWDSLRAKARRKSKKKVVEIDRGPRLAR
jgi:hypothetical protein